MTAAVIFDLYGTLLDISHDSRPFDQLARSATDYRKAIEAALTRDCPTLSDFARAIGIEPPPQLEPLESALEDDLRRVGPFDDSLPTLMALRQHGVKTAVISNLASPYKQPFYTHGIDRLVDCVVFSCDCGCIKPRQQIYELALRQLGCRANDCLMVGDSFRSDVDGPSRIGIMGIHLVRDGRPSRAEHSVGSLDAILAKCNIDFN